MADNKETVGVEIQASFYVREDLEILKGHFPGNPILPGVVQVEMMAQASCFVIPVRLLKPFEIDLKVAFMGIQSTKFRKPITPGMKLKIHCICRKCRGEFNKPIMSYDCKKFIFFSIKDPKFSVLILDFILSLFAFGYIP